MATNVQGLVRTFDAYQREHPWAGFPMALGKKFGDDRGGYLAALIAYYGFFSLFPLLLVLVTVLFFVLADNPGLRAKIVGSALAQFPLIGPQIKNAVNPLHGSAIALVIGIAGALWAGMGVVQVTSNAMDTVWNVPVRKKPSFLKARLRALVMLAVLGVATIVAAGLSGIAAGGGSFSPILKAVALAGSVAVNFGVFLIAFKVLTTEQVSWSDVAPGAVVAAVLWGALQTLGNYYVGHQLRNASQTYGTFAIVIGLLSWLYLGAQVTILAAELNVVRARRLWPRAIQPPLTREEKRALRRLAKQEERRPEEHVEVGFDAKAGGAGASEMSPSAAGAGAAGAGAAGAHETEPEHASGASPAPEDRVAPAVREAPSRREFPRY
jgi:YihY family inner membrane protein